jgi:error-prone DNA polymerase
MSEDLAYAELSCRTNFSFLSGASHADELVQRAAELGIRALGIADVNTLAGIVRAHAAAKPLGFKLLIGAEIQPSDAFPVILHAMSMAGYRRLSTLITRGRRAAKKGACRLAFRDIAQHVGEHLAIAKLPAEALKKSSEKKTLSGLAAYRELYGDRCYLAASLHLDANDDDRLQRFLDLSAQSKVPLLATNDVHYHIPNRRPLHDVLVATQHGVTVAQLGALRFANGERHLKSAAEMAHLFARCPDAVRRTVEAADRCSFSLDELRYEYPAELCPPGLNATQHLADLTWEGAKGRYPQGVPEKVAVLVRKELALIEELRYEAFFLTVWDLVRFARERAILCQGRGSAANSAVCYCLGITSVDPDRSDALFERFISRERNEAPDIDVDFEHERREEVLQYIYRKYGRERAGIVAEVICYRPRSAIRDVGKALGFSLDAVDRLAKGMDPYADTEHLASQVRMAGLDPEAREVRQLVALVNQLMGFPRHLSQHVGGFVITGGPLSELVPIENAAMPDRTVIQWDKDDLDTLGMLKVDCLSLGMLTAIRKCFDFVEQTYGKSYMLATVPPEDQAVYDMICKADTIGVFQIESRAQMSMLPRLKPRTFYDLVIEVAIVRPGPIQGGMVHPFLRRRNGDEPVTYPSPVIEEVLSKTLGVPLFQEQVMRLAVVAAGFTPGEADQLRRAMAAWKKPGVIDTFRQKIRDGMITRGFTLEFADQLFEQIKGFGEYGFPESHAASFALLAYASSWLKCHYPAAFTAALLNSQPMGFYAPAQLIRDLREHGGMVRPADVNLSDWDCTLEPANDGVALRLGLRLVRGLPQPLAEAIMATRRERPFRSVHDIARRAGIQRPMLARLAAADALASLGLSRRTALWQVLALADELPLFANLEDEPDTHPPLREMSLGEQVVADYGTVGLSLKAHPFALIRPEMDKLKVMTAEKIAKIETLQHVRVAGLVLVRQHPSTSKGTIFMTLEDETGVVNLVIWPKIWQRFRNVARGAVAILAEGKLERANGVIHVMPTNIEDVSHALRGISSRSRDFR